MTKRAKPDPHPRYTRSRGVSLLECLAAGTILATAILAGLDVVATQTMVHASSTDSAECLQVLKRELETAILEEFNDLESSTFEVVDEYPAFETRRVVVDRDTNSKEVTVEIRYQTASGSTRVDSLTTLRCSGAQGMTVASGGGVKGMEAFGAEGAEQ